MNFDKECKLENLFSEENYAILLILTADNKKIIRPILTDTSITGAVEEAREHYPNCKVSLYLHELDRKFFPEVPKEDIF